MIKNFKADVEIMDIDFKNHYLKYCCDFSYLKGKPFYFKNQVFSGEYKDGFNFVIYEVITNAISTIYNDIEETFGKDEDVKFKNPVILNLKYSDALNKFYAVLKLDEKEYSFRYDVETGELDAEDLMCFFEKGNADIEESFREQKALNIMTNYLYSIADVLFFNKIKLSADNITLFSIQNTSVNRNWYAGDMKIEYFQENPDTGLLEEYFALKRENPIPSENKSFEKDILKMSEADVERMEKLTKFYKNIDFDKNSFKVENYDKVFTIKFGETDPNLKVSKDMKKLKRIIKDLL